MTQPLSTNRLIGKAAKKINEIYHQVYILFHYSVALDHFTPTYNSMRLYITEAFGHHPSIGDETPLSILFSSFIGKSIK